MRQARDTSGISFQLFHMFRFTNMDQNLRFAKSCLWWGQPAKVEVLTAVADWTSRGS